MTQTFKFVFWTLLSMFLFLGEANPQTPCDDGVWGTPVNADGGPDPDFTARHAALIPAGPYQGNVLIWGPHEVNSSNNWEMSWKIVDPVGCFCIPEEDVVITGFSPFNEGNSECGGHSWDPDGDLLIAGGMLEHDPPRGTDLTFRFLSSTYDWVQQALNMSEGRWYPTVVSLPNGDQLAIGGKNELSAFQNNYEHFVFQDGKWNTGTGIESIVFVGPPGGGSSLTRLDVYPRAHLLPIGSGGNGVVFVSGPTGTSVGIDHLSRTPPYLEGDWESYDTAAFAKRKNGGSVLLPLDLRTPTSMKVKVMILGGDTTPWGGGLPSTSATVEIMDFSLPTPAWTTAPSMTAARVKHNSVLLPDGSIFVIGGEPDPISGPPTILNAEIYRNGAWDNVGFPASWRGDHSTALLLPDATVLTAGGQAYRAWDFQVYEPPYLFCGQRPVITSISSDTWTYGNSYNLFSVLPENVGADRVVLVRPGSVTHGFDTDQRCLILEASFTGSPAVITAPPDGTIAPPGYYMLFLITDEGVPSVATWVKLG